MYNRYIGKYSNNRHIDFSIVLNLDFTNLSRYNNIILWYCVNEINSTQRG